MQVGCTRLLRCVEKENIASFPRFWNVLFVLTQGRIFPLLSFGLVMSRGKVLLRINDATSFNMCFFLL